MHALAITAALALTALAPMAAAEPTPEDRALASVLFEEGRALMAEGKTAEACAKLETSQRLDPGGGTLLNLALCHEALGRTATAFAELVEARGVARRDGRSDRETLAQEHLDAITPRLSYLVVRVPAAPPPGFKVTRDSSDLAQSAWGVRAPVDPGAHRVEATAPGYAPFARDVAITGEAQTIEVDVPPLVALPPVAPPPPPLAPALPPPRPAPPPAESGLRPLQIGALTSGGAAVVALGIGSVAGIIAANHRADSEEADPDCSSDCPEDAVIANEKAGDAADGATGAFIAGGVLAAAAIVMWLVDDDAPPAPSGARAASLSLRF